MTTIDHLVYTVPDLEAAIDDLEQRLGVRPVPGGRHATRGTRNALVKLDNGCYLEILAVDEENTDISPPRWMGVDLLTGPKITRWALKTNDLERASATLRAYDDHHGEIVAGSRALADGSMLKWRMTLPLATPEVDVIPFCIDWSETETEPFDALPDMGCCLASFRVFSPGLNRMKSEPVKVRELFERLGTNVPVFGEVATLKATIRCPNGLVTL